VPATLNNRNRHLDICKPTQVLAHQSHGMISS